MSKMEEVRTLRGDPGIHYNCAQAVFIPFAKDFGLDQDTAFALSSQFGSGMGMGSVCGALTGALMVLGLKGGTPAQRTALIRAFRESHDGELGCAALLKIDRDKGNKDKKPHCDRMVYDAVQILEAILGEE